jgi:polyribonucleotide nucleotidyltransferase
VKDRKSPKQPTKSVNEGKKALFDLKQGIGKKTMNHPATESTSAASPAAAVATESMSLGEQVNLLEKKLKDALEKRDSMQVKVKNNQMELSKLLAQKGPQKPKQNLKDIEEQIAELERERTIHSMSLADEKQILKKIYKLEKLKSQIKEWEEHDRQIKERKAMALTLREVLKEEGTVISEMRTELSILKTASELGCEHVKDLLGKKVSCPTEKLGKVIGKDGKNVKQLMKNANVTVDIDREEGNLRVVGSLDSIDAFLQDLEKVISKTQKTVSVSAELVTYLTTKGVVAQSDLQKRHPGVFLRISRDKTTTDIQMEGLPADIDNCHADLKELEKQLQIETIQMEDSRQSAVIVGKQGATISGLVASHQVAIDVQRPDDDSTTVTSVTVIGPSSNVQAALDAIEELRAANRETEQSVPVDRAVKNALLLNRGAAMQSLRKEVNTAKDATEVDGYVGLSFGKDGILMKGKAKSLPRALHIVKKEIARVESMIVRISVDPVVIPVIIGKGGEGIKKIKEGTSANIELDRTTGEIAVCALNKTEVDRVAQLIRSLTAKYHVERISLDEPVDFLGQYKDVLRKESRAIRPLAFMSADESKRQIVLRGREANVKKAAEMIRGFVASNYVEEIAVKHEDFSALLVGGKGSKIAALSTQYGVQLQSDRARNMVVAKGEKDKVTEAVESLRQFLYGGDAMAVSMIALNEDVFGIVIGKSGKTKSQLQEDHPSVTINAYDKDTSIILRGPKEDVESCRLDIMKLISTARITRTVEVSEAQMKNLNRMRWSRQITEEVPVSVTVRDGRNIIIRGEIAEVQMALAVLNEQLEGVYESRLHVDPALFPKIEDTCRDQSHFQRIMDESNAKVFLDISEKQIVVTGKRDAVRLAKMLTTKFFEFLFGSKFCRFTAPGPALSTVGKATSLAEVSGLSGANVVLDRDINSILVSSSSSEKVQKAIEILKQSIGTSGNRMHEWQFKKSEDWLISAIIGKKGARVKRLRKKTGCNINIASTERKVTVFADKEELVTKARQIIDELLNKERKVRLAGDEKSAADAKARVTEWFASCEEAAKEKEQTMVKKSLRRDQIPAVIGPNGSVISGLEKEFGCKITVDRSACTVLVHGSTQEQRMALLAKVEKIVSQKDTNANKHETDIPAEAKPPKKDESSKSEANDGTKPQVNTSKEETSDFPVLSGTKDEGNTRDKKQPTAGPDSKNSWAAILKVNNTQVDAKDMETAGTVESETPAESPSPSVVEDLCNEELEVVFVGDVVEEMPSERDIKIASFVRMTSEEAWDAVSSAEEEEDDALGLSTRKRKA